MIHFTIEQIEDIINSYKEGRTLSEIGLSYSVSRPTIAKVLKGNYQAYTGKKRVSTASENQTKVCSKCNKVLPLDNFNKGNSKFGRRSYCRECEHLVQNTDEKRKRRRELDKIRRKDPEYVSARNHTDRCRIHTNIYSMKLYILRNAKQRAKDKNLYFNIDVSDIILPEKCPLLNIPLELHWGKTQDNSYSLDRIDPKKGYVKGNVWVISRRANVIKNDASLEELQLITKNLERELNN